MSGRLRKLLFVMSWWDVRGREEQTGETEKGGCQIGPVGQCKELRNGGGKETGEKQEEQGR